MIPSVVSYLGQRMKPRNLHTHQRIPILDLIWHDAADMYGTSDDVHAHDLQFSLQLIKKGAWTLSILIFCG